MSRDRAVLKINARKLQEEPRAFFFVQDDSETLLYIDKKFDDPKRFGNLKKVRAISQRLFGQELSKSARMCAGVVRRKDGALQFRPVLQKANVTLLKKGLKAFKKEIGPAKIAKASAPVGPVPTAAPLLEALTDALRAFHKRARGDVDASAEAAAALEALDDYISARGADGDEAAWMLVRVGGKPLSAWQATLSTYEADSGEDVDDETMTVLRQELAEAEAELAVQAELLAKTSEEADTTEVQLVDRMVDFAVCRMLSGKPIGDLGAVSGKMGRLTEKASTTREQSRHAKRSHDDVLIDIDLTRERIDLRAQEAQLQARQQRVDELTVQLVDVSLEEALVTLLGGGTPTRDTLKSALGGLPGDLSAEEDARQAALQAVLAARSREEVLGTTRKLSGDFARLNSQTRSLLSTIDDDSADTTTRKQATARLAEVSGAVLACLRQISVLRAHAASAQ